MVRLEKTSPNTQNKTKNTRSHFITELPGYAPGAGYRMLEALLGRVEDLGVVNDFTTQTGDFTGTSPIYENTFKHPIQGHKYDVFNH